MQGHDNTEPVQAERIACNKGKLAGAKPPLRPKHVWATASRHHEGPDRPQAVSLDYLATTSAAGAIGAVARAGLRVPVTSIETATPRARQASTTVAKVTA